MHRLRAIVVVCVTACLFNLLLTGALAAGGVLKTAQPGDTTQLTKFDVDGTQYTVGDDSRRFVAEPVTDVDAFYNAVVRLQNSEIPLYGVATDKIQAYRYAPVVAFAFTPLAAWGYSTFKILVLLTSAVVVAVASYAILRVETDHHGLTVSQQTLAGLAVATVGFGPVVSNLKVGQISPFIYASIAGFWVAHRRGYTGVGGALLVVPALTKPYFLAPAAVVIARPHYRGMLGLSAGVTAGVAASVLVVGTDITAEYFSTVAAYAAGTEAVGVPTITQWSVESVYPFFTFSSFALLGRVTAALGFAGLWVLYLRRGATDDDAIGLVAASVVLVPFVIQQATNIDLAVLLVAYLVVGAELYNRGSERSVTALAVSFLLCHGHWYVLEVAVGDGHVNLLDVVPSVIIPLLQFLQPAAYALYVVAALSVLVVLRRRRRETLPSFSVGDH